ncbi:MAG: HAD family hydrolase [Candidatus Binatia bacterium]
MIDTIIFDAEGVVVDSEGMWDKGQEEFLRRRGLDYDRDAVKPLLTGRSVIEGVRILQEMYGFAGDPGELARERTAIMKDLFKDGLSFICGFENFYEAIKDQYKTCIATSMDSQLLAVADQWLRLSELFQRNVFSIAAVGHIAKPHPDLFLYAARKLHTPVGNCVVIEDAPHGVEAAKRAGMKCIALTTTYGREKLVQADLIVDHYAQIDLPEFCGTIL